MSTVQLRQRTDLLLIFFKRLNIGDNPVLKRSLTQALAPGILGGNNHALAITSARLIAASEVYPHSAW